MKKLASNSLEFRNLVRHKMPRPTIYFRDKKRHKNKNKCRKIEKMSRLDEQEFFENFLNQQEYFRSKEEMDDLEMFDISDGYSFEEEESFQ